MADDLHLILCPNHTIYTHAMCSHCAPTVRGAPYKPASGLCGKRVARAFRCAILLVPALLFLPSGNLAAQDFKPQDLGPAPPRPGSLQTPSHRASPEARTQSLKQIFHDYWQEKLKHSPEFASEIGDRQYDSQLPDHSAQAYNAVLQRGTQWIEELGAIDTTGMSAQEKLSKRLLVDDLVDQQESSVCQPWQTPVTPFSGIQVDLPNLAESLQFRLAEDYSNYIARLNKVPAAFLQVETDMMLGEQSGRSEPQFLMKKVLAQVKEIASAKPEDTPFAKPIEHFPSTIPPQQQAELRKQVLDAIRTKVQPAYTHFAKYLTVDYISHARTEPGIWANQDGSACYDYLVEHFTAPGMTPDQVYAMGVADVARIQPQLLAAIKQLGYSDMRSFRAGLLADPKQHAQSAVQLIALYRQFEDQMEAKLPQLVTKIPQAPLKVAAMPAFNAAFAPPTEYRPGTLDGSRPGQVLVNTSNLKERLLPSVEAAAYLEGVPGHHLQISLAREMETLPAFRRYAIYPAFVDGWALYSAELGNDVGLYQGLYSKAGLLETEMWYAACLVVDPGIHARHWTREQAIQYFREHTGADNDAIEQQVNRIIALPGRMLAYDVGRLQILKLRTQAQQALGKNFDLRTFNNQILDSGALPLEVLQQQIESWIHDRQQSTEDGKGK